MTDAPQRDPRLPKWASPIVMLFLTTLALMAVLQLLAQFGAKAFLEETARQTDSALRALNPAALGQRFMTIFTDIVNPCSHVVFSQLRACMDAHPVGQDNFVQTSFHLVHALFVLVWQIAGESWVSAIVDALQLIVGFSAAIWIAARVGALKPEMSYVLMVAFIPFGIVCTCLLSLPLLGLVHLGSWLMGDVLPAPLHFGLLGGGWSAFMAACYSRTFEAVLHDKFGRFMQRVAPPR